MMCRRKKIRTRYDRALKLIPELVNLCDVMHIYDNTETPFRIFKKRKEQFFYWESPEWTQHDIEILTGVLFSR
jgi:predicted ABC-type ATPase